MKPKPLKEFLDYVGGEVCRSDETEVVMVEMARRLRALDERHRPDILNATTPECIGAPSYVPCKCGAMVCPERSILDGENP